MTIIFPCQYPKIHVTQCSQTFLRLIGTKQITRLSCKTLVGKIPTHLLRGGKTCVNHGS